LYKLDQFVKGLTVEKIQDILHDIIADVAAVVDMDASSFDAS